MIVLVALSLACHDIMQQPGKIWRYRFLFLLIVLQAKRAIANTVFTPSINPTRGVIIQPHFGWVSAFDVPGSVFAVQTEISAHLPIHRHPLSSWVPWRDRRRCRQVHESQPVIPGLGIATSCVLGF